MINKPMMEIKRKTFTQEFVHKKCIQKRLNTLIITNIEKINEKVDKV